MRSFFKVLSLTLGVVCGASIVHADQYANKQQRVALEIIDPVVPGASSFVFYCSPQTHCGGERYTVRPDGRKEVTFQYGEHNIIRFWPEGKNYRLDHIQAKNGKVTHMTLQQTASKPTAIPDLSLFNPNWGAKGTRVTIEGDHVSYCFDADPCDSGAVYVVGDRIILANIGRGNFLLVGRFGPDKSGKAQYSVSFHRSDGQSFQAPFLVEEETTSSIQK